MAAKIVTISTVDLLIEEACFVKRKYWLLY
jgi:hypothetical protein